MSVSQQAVKFTTALDVRSAIDIPGYSGPARTPLVAQGLFKPIATPSPPDVNIDATAIYETTVGASSSVTLNLFDGSLLAEDGITTVALATLKVFAVFITSGTGTLTIGNAGAGAHSLWFGGSTQTKSIDSTGPAFLDGSQAGKTVDNSNKLVKIANPGGTGIGIKVIASGVKQ